MSEEAEVKQEEQQQEPSIEERAKGMGWVPKDEFRGAPDRWSDAETFVRRAEEELPIARATTRRLERELLEMKNTVKEFAAHHKAVAEREYQKALRDLKAQQKQAVAEADTERYDRIEQEIQQVHQERAQIAGQAAPPVDPEFSGWLDDNTWYESDRQLRVIADAIGKSLIDSGTGLRGRNFFDA